MEKWNKYLEGLFESLLEEEDEDEVVLSDEEDEDGVLEIPI